MDYRNLLHRYLKHLLVAEGGVFLTNSNRRFSSAVGDIDFTDAEWDLLKHLALTDLEKAPQCICHDDRPHGTQDWCDPNCLLCHPKKSG